MHAIVLTGGGTAGHVTANLALLPQLKCKFDEIHYFGSIDGIEQKLLADYPYVVYHALPCVKLRRSFDLRNLSIPFVLLRGIRRAKKLLKTIKPDVIFAKGGYVSLPAVLGARKTPVVLHESDMSFGLANRIAAKRARTICTTFGLNRDKCVHTGTPLRAELYRGDAAYARSKYRADKPVLLVMGGSQGATAVNRAIHSQLDTLCERYFILHLTGKGKSDASIHRARYVQIEYDPNPADLFAAAEIVITRGGSNAIHEFAALKKPMIIIPLSRAESRGDQIENAAYFEAKGLAIHLPQETLSPETLRAALTRLEENKEQYKSNMAAYPADGTKAVLREILAAAQDGKTHGDKAEVGKTRDDKAQDGKTRDGKEAL